ncbi:MAG: caspase family protein [Candidatus Latescibacterota bacterium]|nr:MAG: caspase family protein [Candidatus Latescibacterota bacterium]
MRQHGKKSRWVFHAIVAAVLATICAGVPPDAISGVEIQYTPEEFVAEKKYALIVGINNYDSDDIPDLNFAVRDAKALYDVLVDQDRGAFSEETVVLLTDDTDKLPTERNIGKYLKRIARQAQEEDLVLIFFSGHGFEEGGRSYLAPRDADLDILDDTAIERDRFIRKIDEIDAKKVVVILDACHAGGISRGGKGAEEDMALSDRYYDEFTKAQGRAFIASCSGGQLSYENKETGHGAFTGSLVRGLSGEADRNPEDGLVTLHELRRFLEKDVSEWARRNGKKQQPQINLEGAVGDIPVALNSDYLHAEARRLADLEAEGERLRTGLANEGELTPEERSQGIALVDKYSRDEPLDSDETQMLQMVTNLVDEKIDVPTYRAAIIGLTIKVYIEEAPPPQPRRRWFVTLLGGGFSHGGDNFSGDISFAPAVRLGYSFGRWDLVGGYTGAPGSLDDSSYVGEFDASLLTLGPRLNFDMASRFLGYVELGLGGYLGSEVRNDEANLAVDVGAGLDIGIRSGFGVTAAASFVFSNATMTPPSDPKMAQGFYVGVGLTYTKIK